MKKLRKVIVKEVRVIEITRELDVLRLEDLDQQLKAAAVVDYVEKVERVVNLADTTLNLSEKQFRKESLE